MSNSFVIFSFLFIPFWLLLSYLSIFCFFDILRKKAKSESRINCVENLLSPRRNSLLTKEEIVLLKEIDPGALKGFRAARTISAGGLLLWIFAVILCALWRMFGL